MTGALLLTQLAVQDHMDSILTNFKPGARITVAVRFPGKDTADFLMTSDDLAEVAVMMERRLKAEGRAVGNKKAVRRDVYGDSTKTFATDRFTDSLKALGVTLPLRDTDEVGSAADNTGREIFTLDVNRERPDEEIEQLTYLVILAVNTCGGFKLVRTEEAPNG